MTSDEAAGIGIVFDHTQAGINDSDNARMPHQRFGTATVGKVFEIDGLAFPFAMMFSVVTDLDVRTVAAGCPIRMWGTPPPSAARTSAGTPT